MPSRSGGAPPSAPPPDVVALAGRSEPPPQLASASRHATAAAIRRMRYAPGAGSVNENVLPAPSALVTQMRPPCWATIRSQIARPMPVPA